MNFAEILDEWEKRQEPTESSPSSPSSGSASRKALESWLKTNGVEDKDRDAASASGKAAERQEYAYDTKRLLSMKSQAILDLHGMKEEEALAAVRRFIDESAALGLEKVLIIHGKGLHSQSGPVLKNATRRVIEAHPRAGRFGEAAREEGGSGAVWVLIRQRN